MSTLSNRDKATKLQASANSTGAAAAVGSEASKLSMALGVVSVDTWDKHDIQDIIFWMRAIISLVIGIVWGFIPITGMIGLTSWGFSNTTIVYVYYTKFLNVDEEELGKWDLFFEGFAAAFGVFLLSWITTYSAFLDF